MFPAFSGRGEWVLYESFPGLVDRLKTGGGAQFGGGHTSAAYRKPLRACVEESSSSSCSASTAQSHMHVHVRSMLSDQYMLTTLHHPNPKPQVTLSSQAGPSPPKR